MQTANDPIDSDHFFRDGRARFGTSYSIVEWPNSLKHEEQTISHCNSWLQPANGSIDWKPTGWRWSDQIKTQANFCCADATLTHSISHFLSLSLSLFAAPYLITCLGCVHRRCVQAIHSVQFWGQPMDKKPYQSIQWSGIFLFFFLN